MRTFYIYNSVDDTKVGTVRAKTIDEAERRAMTIWTDIDTYALTTDEGEPLAQSSG